MEAMERSCQAIWPWRAHSHSQLSAPTALTNIVSAASTAAARFWQNLAGLAAAFMSLPPAWVHASVALPAYGRLVLVYPTVRSAGPLMLTARSTGEAALLAPDLHVNLYFLDCLFLGFL